MFSAISNVPSKKLTLGIVKLEREKRKFLQTTLINVTLLVKLINYVKGKQNPIHFEVQPDGFPTDKI